MDADAATAWAAYEALLKRLIESGNLISDLADDLRSSRSKEAWLQAYQSEHGRLWWSEPRSD